MENFSGSGATAGTRALGPLVHTPHASGTDALTTRFVLYSQGFMVAFSVACAWLQAGQVSVYAITTASFVVYVCYALWSKNQLFKKLLLFGLVAGTMGLWADHFSVALAGTLVYPEGYKLLSSPLYMPLSWAIALTQLGYIAQLLYNHLGLWKSSLLLALLGGMYIPLYEHLALDAGWWYYHNCSMIWDTPYFIILFECLLAASLPLLVSQMNKRKLWQSLAVGALAGAWLLICTVIAYYSFFFSAEQYLVIGSLCASFPAVVPYVDLCKYSLASVLLIILGTMFWNGAYIIIIRDGFRNKFVEMPVPAAASNLAWEFVWGFCFVTDLGKCFVWGLQTWFFLDLFILWGILRWGHKQINTPLLRKYFIPLFCSSVLLWAVGFFLFIKDGLDTTMGATSAYMITVIMELLYILFFLSAGANQKYYSTRAAWLRITGNVLMSIFVYIHYKEMLLLQYMCLLVLGLDVIYLMLLLRNKARLEYLVKSGI